MYEIELKDNQLGRRIMSVHVSDDFNFFGSVLIRRVMRFVGKVTKKLNSAVITALSVVNILSISLVFNGSFGDIILFSMINK